MYAGNYKGGTPKFGSSKTDSSYKPRKENIRFGVNKKGRSTKGNLVMDEHIQEATPEHLRIEIDKIFNEFLADPEKSEYIFPSDLNNLQRKYIHYRAQVMNLVSKSHGKEPNRQLHLKKKPKQLASQSFQVSLSDEIYNELQSFDQNYARVETQPHSNYRAIKRSEKVYSKIQDCEPVVPQSGGKDRKIQTIRQKLPIFEKREFVMNTINSNQVTIISSETGSGKTTQIPQYILEHADQNNLPCKIICTQPRRISTIAAAERVAYERSETVGGSVGYHIRLESKHCFKTNLLFCTVGVFLRNLMCGSKCLENITHIIVDEIHERDKQSDFLLICLKQNLSLYPHLKVILMSATVDTSKFQQYFNSSAILSIPGRLFSIETYFVEDILSMTAFFTPQMRTAMAKLQQKKQTVQNAQLPPVMELSPLDQDNLNLALEAYMNFSEEYDYTLHYDEATADLLQLFISEDVPVDQPHSDRGWTALMLACHLGDVEFIEKLCTLGANMNVPDKLGKTAYDYAKMANKNNILLLLDTIKDQEPPSGNAAPNLSDPLYLRQLYDMTTPDDFIDYDLIVTLIQYIHAQSDKGSILVFLPGYDEIMQCNDHIINSSLDSSAYRIFFLHSSMGMRDQCDVFKPLDQRKLILSTNIAETSITVEDVVFVIDAGKAKEKVYDSYNKLSALQTQWISRACAKQRQGRAGRVQKGFCFRLYSTQRYNHMAEERVPEILRVSLEELCLQAKIIAPQSMNIYNFLCLALDPPTLNSVGVAIENLQSLGALDKEEDLTRLGEYLALLTVEPRLGKMLIFGCIFKCLEPMLTLCASMAHKDPFQLPSQANLRSQAAAKRRELINGVPSDHSVYLLVFQQWQENCATNTSKQFCQEYFISETTMYGIVETRRQLIGQLRALGFIKAHSINEFNVNSHSWGLVKAIMSAAYFPNIAYPAQRGLALATRNEKKIIIHNTSVCSTKKYLNWYFYDEMVKNKINFMIRGVSICTPLMISLMCGIDTVYPTSHSINIDDWLEFYFGDTYAIKFRKAIHSLVDKCMINPGYSLDKENLIIIDTVAKVMDMSEKNEGFVQPPSVGEKPKFLYNATNAAPKRNNGRPITRNGMRQPTFNKEPINAERIQNRYIPPHMRAPGESAYRPRNVFDNNHPSTSGANELAYGLQNFANLTVTDTERANVTYQPQGRFNKHHNYYNGYDNFTVYNSQNRGYNFNPNQEYHIDNSRAQFDNNYGQSSSDDSSPERMALYEEVARNIVMQNNLNLADMEYNDNYLAPPLPQASQSLYGNQLNISAPSNLYQLPSQISNMPVQNTYNNYLSRPSNSLALVKHNNHPSRLSNSLALVKQNNHPSRPSNSLALVKQNQIYTDNPIYVFIKAVTKRNVDIAQSCKKWVFSPQTEKKILEFANQGKQIFLIFFVKEFQMLMGVAKYLSMNIGGGLSKPTASIAWIYYPPLVDRQACKLVNPYTRKSLYETQDGDIVRKDVAEILMSMYATCEARNKK
ncbi:unnamed protein product [Ceutorhynchus assimilis]|uniref:RNA helicase n=1 Tax=Ceutorhynchus assimilis TaxID=467358 RepID=A0A9N9MYR5_9CUCU|nr:unnamed protein product [Ceutorhynchus assimilis]